MTDQVNTDNDYTALLSTYQERSADSQEAVEDTAPDTSSLAPVPPTEKHSWRFNIGLIKLAPDDGPLLQIPEELRQRLQWVVWFPEDGKKVPYDPYLRISEETGVPEEPFLASVTDSNTWSTFDEAYWTTDWLGFAGIGFVFTADDLYTGIDLDNAINPATGRLYLWAQYIVDLLDSYTEVSPSGTGVHIIVRGKLPKALRRGSKATLGIEMYDRERYFAMTGDHFEGTPTTIEERQEILDQFYHDQKLIRDMCRNDKRIERLFNGDTSDHDGDDSRADMALCNHLLHFASGDRQIVDRLFRQSGLMRDKWDELRGETTYGQLTIERAAESRQDKTKPQGEWHPEEQPQVGGEFRVRRLSDVVTRPVRWWWYPYLPFGHLCSLEGDGGTGKSTLAALLGAHMTRGEHPYTGMALMAPRTVLILSSEEAVEEMLSPKMDAYEADRDLVIVADIPRWDEKDQWRSLMNKFRPGLVIVDPLQEFFGGRINSNTANQVREALTPLGGLMAEFDCIGLCIQHFGKSANERKAIHKAVGSVDIGARMRCILQVEEVGEGCYLLIHAKHNLGPAGEDIAYTLEPCQIGEDVVVPQVVWGDPVEGRTDREAAKTVIRRTLGDGEKTTKEMRQVREEHGFSDSTWERALRDLGVKANNGHYPQLE